MELRQLVYFIAVAEELHFGHAVERLHIAQPAVSQQVARLERELSVRLLDRTSRSVRLTAAGAALLPQARRAVRAVDDVARLAQDLAGGTRGAVRVGTTEHMGWRLRLILEAFRASHPHVAVTVTSARTPQKLGALRDRQLDVAFVRSVEDAEDLELLDLWGEPLQAALPERHPLATSPAVPLTALADMPVSIIPREQDPRLHDLFLQLCRSAGFEPVLGPAYHSVEDTLANIAVSDTLWSPLHPTHNALVDGRHVPGVAIRPFTDVAVSARCSLAWLTHQPPPTALPFIDTVASLLGCGALLNEPDPAVAAERT